MKKCILFVFSGTGNTLRVASYYKEYLAGDYETEIIPIEPRMMHQLNSQSAEADLVGFGYPIHALNAPQVVISFARALCRARKGAHKAQTCRAAKDARVAAPCQSTAVNAFIFETSGEGLHVNDASSDMLRRILARGGFSILTDRHFVMPYNMIVRHCDAMVKQMTVYARALARSNAREIIEGKHERNPFHPLHCLLSAVLRIEWLYAKAQGPFMKVDAHKCIHCGKCVGNCPMHNISERDGKITMGHSCALCVSCSFGCPANAISIGLLNGWKVNGEYDFARIVKDSALPFPFITANTKGGYRIYRRYYMELNQRFAGLNTTILPQDFRP